MEYLIIFFAVVTILLIAALAALIFILCEYNVILNFVFHEFMLIDLLFGFIQCFF